MKATITAWTARISLLLTVCMAAMNPAQAGPASPDPTQITQPDGTTFQAVMRGDEFQGWMETADGYTVVRNANSGAFEYATRGPEGEMIPSGIVVSASSTSASQDLMPPKGLRPPRNADLEQYQADFLNALRAARTPTGINGVQTGTWTPTPVSGPKKILVILVNFTNMSMSSGASTYWNNAIFNTGASSVAKYYQDNSYSSVSISPVTHTQAGSPSGVLTVNLAQNHPNCGNISGCNYATESAWINGALAAAAPYVNFPSLDTNGDGTISVDEALIYFVLAGYETSAGSGLTPNIWAHAWGGSGVAVSGKNINHWALNGEMYNASIRMQMGVIAHEAGHAMGGLPDLYDISGNNQGLGVFSIMASGSWGGQVGETGGATPSGLDAWSRQYLGWSTPRTPSNGTTVSFASPQTDAQSTVLMMNSASSTSEFWLVENRPPVGWDAGMYRYLGTWTGGLLIQHIDLNIGSKSANSFNAYVAGSHQGNMAEEPSTATCSMKVVTTPATSSRGCPTILFYAGNGTAFNGASTPNSNYYSGAASSVGLSGISTASGTMTATVQSTTTTTCTYTLSASSAAPPAIAINGSVVVTALTGCAWTATSNAAWLSITSGSSGSGNGTVLYSVAANSSASSRTGTLTIAGNTFTVTQSGASSTASLTRNALFVNASSSGNKTSVLRLINRTSQGGTVTATAYNESGTVVGTANMYLSSISPQQMLTFTSAQLEAAIGYTPTSGTAKYRIAFTANVADFQIINFIKDVASGNLMLGQAQVDDRGAGVAGTSTRNAFFVNPSTSTNKTSVVRLVNLSALSGSVTASAYDESGMSIGMSNASLGTLAAQQMLTFTSAQLEAMIGFTPASSTLKYRVVFTASLPSFELLNFIKDVRTGNLALGQEQIN
jgi:M6 family metalloprotease-like protein